MNLFSLLGGSGLAGADGPDGLVGDDDVLPLLGAQVEYAALELCLADSLLLVGFALCQALADAEDYLQTVGQSQIHLLLEDGGCLVVVLTTLAVAQDDVLGAGALDHGGAHLTGVGSALLVGAVLGADGDAAVLQQIGHSGQVDEGRADDDVAVGLLSSENLLEFLGEGYTLLQVLVHFPVACYNVLSHNAFFVFNMYN